MKSTSTTLRRKSPVAYEVSYWSDGVARFDGASGVRQGAWQAFADPEWHTRVARLIKHLGEQKGIGSTADVFLVVQGEGGLLTYGGIWSEQEPPFWTIATLIDGMVANTVWTPLDSTSIDDFSPWAGGIPMTFQGPDVSATALALSSGLLVLAGSYASPRVSASLERIYSARREELIGEGAFESDGDRYRLARHVLFTKPSAAASVLVGTNTSGTGAWKDAMGRSWRQLGL